MFSSKSLIVSALTLRSLIHFEFIFVHGVRKCSNFIFFHVAVQFSQHHLLKRLSFLHCTFLPLCQRYGNHMCVGLSLVFLSCSIELYTCFCASTMLSSLLQLCSVVCSGEPGSSSSVFLFRIALAIQGLLCFHTNCKIFCSSSLKNGIGYLIRIALIL